MKNPVYVLIIAALSSLSMSAAAAASGIPSPTAITVKAGGEVQTASAAGTGGVALGADYIFHPSSLIEPFNLSLYGDLLGKSFGAGVAIRNGGPVYVGAGAGFYSVSISPGGGCAVLPGGGCSQPTYTSSGLGGKVFGGFAVAPFVSVELGYHIMPQAHGIQTNAVSGELTLRF
ncbi:MAG TPA: hypothetical protein VNF68_01770 [Candidatus Baltobacteraceae bacterium]|nr:hypothetical protein [Candidatus Baltobacteraceae bacterium]